MIDPGDPVSWTGHSQDEGRELTREATGRGLRRAGLRTQCSRMRSPGRRQKADSRGTDPGRSIQSRGGRGLKGEGPHGSGMRRVEGGGWRQTGLSNEGKGLHEVAAGSGTVAELQVSSF